MTPNKEGGAGATDNTVIGESILINGKLSGDEDLTVRGRVEGELTLSRTLIVEPSGIVKANVAVKNAIISGVVVGNINATESVELTREGRMVGDIHAPRVIIVDGASFRGRVDMGEVEPGRINVERPTRPVTRSVAPPPRPPAPPARIEVKGRVAPPAKPLPPPPPPASLPAPVRQVAPPSPVRTASPQPVRPAAPPPPPVRPATPPPVAEVGKKKMVVVTKKKAK